MGFLEVTGILLVLAAALAWINLKVLRLPTTIGLMLLAMGGAGGLLLVHWLVPGLDGVEPARRLVEAVDFDDTLLHGMLGFLLFAGALHVNLSDLRQQVWLISTLATVGVVATTALVGLATWGLSSVMGLELPLLYCFIFGSLIAPTDPIAVLAVLKKVGAPKSIETKLAGESLFNDGVGVVIFLALLSVAGLSNGHGDPSEDLSATPRGEVRESQTLVESHDQAAVVAEVELTQADPGSLDIEWGEVGKLFAVEAGGGLAMGLGLGLLAFVLLRWCDDYKTEVLITLAVVTGGYALCSALHISGPLAMVVAGLLVGNPGRDRAMSTTTAERIDSFWELVDEILNAVLFVLIGLEVLVLSLNAEYLLAGLIAVPLVLLARFVAVGGGMSVLRNFRGFTPHAAKVMTWAGLRGGISVALALALQAAARGHGDAAQTAAEVILTMTYVVVAFSIIGQGLTIAPLLRWCGLSGRHDPYGGR